ncbi:MAG: transporter substrate-binding domain-containing protein [Paraglaciecola sp.]|uniref:substrate-binding periplasmic protein n=1 Tax=Paraglaciecola sp. TaxID=1920173 RepID=UPI0032661602
MLNDKLYLALLGAIVFTLLTCNVSAATVKKIHVVTEYFQSYQFENKKGELSGFAVEVVERLFDMTEYEAVIDVLPWSRAYKIASEQENTMIFSIAFTASRRENFKWVGILSQDPLSVWGLKKKFPGNGLTLENLKQHPFVAIRGTNPDDVITELGFSHVVRVASQEQMLGMLFKNRADFFVSGNQVMMFRAKALGYKFSDFSSVYQFENLSSKLGIAFNINSEPKIITSFREAFLELEASGELSLIKQKWNVKY